jgi:hypothetical protein
MSALRDATMVLRDLETLLTTAAPGDLDPALVAARVRTALRLLGSEESRWLGTTEARRLLGVGSENTIKAWARLGLLRSRTLPNGRTQVLLEDVLQRRAENTALLAIDERDLTPEELQVLHEERPGRAPWAEPGPDPAS